MHATVTSGTKVRDYSLSVGVLLVLQSETNKIIAGDRLCNICLGLCKRFFAQVSCSINMDVMIEIRYPRRLGYPKPNNYNF